MWSSIDHLTPPYDHLIPPHEIASKALNTVEPVQESSFTPK